MPRMLHQREATYRKPFRNFGFYIRRQSFRSRIFSSCEGAQQKASKLRFGKKSNFSTKFRVLILRRPSTGSLMRRDLRSKKVKYQGMTFNRHSRDLVFGFAIFEIYGNQIVFRLRLSEYILTHFFLV